MVYVRYIKLRPWPCCGTIPSSFPTCAGFRALLDDDFTSLTPVLGRAPCPVGTCPLAVPGGAGSCPLGWRLPPPPHPNGGKRQQGWDNHYQSYGKRFKR